MCPYILSFGSEILPEDSPIWDVELVMDIIMAIDVFFNFLKADRINRDLKSIAEHYITGYFIFDLVSCVPTIVSQRKFSIYWLHMFRIVHLTDITDPIYKLCKVLL